MTVNKAMDDLNLTEEAVVLGSLLGDAHIEKRGNSYRLKIKHGHKQEEYLNWKYEKLIRILLKKPTLIKNGKGGIYKAFYVNSKSGLYLKKYHDLFYVPVNDPLRPRDKFKKVITLELIKSLPYNPLLIAVWFLDDGHTRTDSVGGRFATDCFTLNEVHLLKEYLASVYNVQTNIVTFINDYNPLDIKDNYYLSIVGNANFRAFIDLIKPIVNEIPTMAYKIEIYQSKKSL
jgi:hypothetical protein